MNNVTTEVKGGKLIITCDISAAAIKKAPLSGTGKTRLVASTNGAILVDGDVKLSLNVMAPKA